MKKSFTAKLWKVMRICAVQAIIAITLCGVTLAHPNYAQVLDREISITITDLPFEKALHEIEAVAQVKFAYSINQFHEEPNVSLSIEKKTLRTLLEELLTPRKIRYNVHEKEAAITLKKVAAESTDDQSSTHGGSNGASLHHTLIQVTGTVTEGSTQTPDFLFRSILTRYDGKIKAGNPGFIHSFSWVDSTSEYNKYKNRVQVIGASIAQLYYLAYGDTVQNAVHFRNINWEFPDTIKHPHLKTSYGKLWHEPILEVTDHAPFKWSKTSPVNRFNYSLKVPEGTGHAWYLQAAMRNDLDTYFGYSVTVETRQMPYWRLSAPDKKGALQKLKSLDQSKKLNIRDMDYPFEYQNAVMQDVITFLGGFYGYGSMDFGKLPKSEQSAFIDETGITDKIDFTLDRRMSFEEIRMHLKTLGLELTKAYKPFRVVVIRNPQETSLH